MAKCVLCEKSIENHDPDIHTLHIDDQRVVEICERCIQKLVRWHRDKLAKMFPTKATKRYLPNND